MTKVILDFSLKEIIINAIKEISANAIKPLIIGSASNKPDTNKRPNGIRIIEPCKKMKK